MRKIFKWIGVILLFVLTGFFILVMMRQNRKFEAPLPAIHASRDKAIIAKGRSLVFGIAHCANCHSPKEHQQAVLRGEEVALSGGLEFKIPIGVLYSKNLTPDASGIGNMSDAALARALRYGIGKNGNALFDFMPFHNTSDEDITAIISYLRSQPAVKNEIPKNKLNLLGKIINAFVLEPVGPSGDVPVSVKVDSTAEYGQYIAASVANCKGCHSNRNLMTGAFIGEEYAGGLEFGVDTDSGKYTLTTPNLTPDTSGRIKGWTQEQFIQRFRAGARIPGSHMPWGPFSRMSDTELKAVYNFLQTVKPVRNNVPFGLVKKK
jgi:mono/diheme cytochrome c family protein